MTALADKWHETGEMLDQALERFAEKQRGLDGDVRLRLGSLADEIRIERGITRDQVAALHVRIDGVETALTQGLAGIESQLKSLVRALQMNGSGGQHA